jgi:putative flippase GtrA
LLFVFTEYCGVWYLFSATLSFLAAAVVNYSFQYFITFKGHGGELKKQFTTFVIIAAVGLLINNSLLYIQVEWLGLWYMLAKAIAAGVVLIWNFFMNKYVTFNGN